MALLQALDLEGKPTDWDAPSAAVDVGHHLVYALAAGLAPPPARSWLLTPLLVPTPQQDHSTAARGQTGVRRWRR